ncbi:MAG: 4-alpha-glucanotransferase, partial [Vicinamibacterales bacterium]
MADPSPGRFTHGRHAGVIAPLFSIPSASSWGIGEIADLPVLARWLESAGLDFVQLLPINEMPGGQSSPYSALSAMAIDPIYLAIERLEDFRAAGGLDALSGEGRGRVSDLRGSTRVAYEEVRAAKRGALAIAFNRFTTSAAADSPRLRAFESFVAQEAWWLDTYALFRALHDEHEGR